MINASANASSQRSSSPSSPPLDLVRSQTASPSSTHSSVVSNIANERVASSLRECERAWEEAFIRGNELALAMIAARAGGQLSRTAGHQIVAAIGRANALAGEGQSVIAAVHQMLDRFAKAQGLEVTAYGDGRKTPDDAVFGGP